MISAFSFAASQPWAIEPDAYRTVLEVASRHGDPEALATKVGRKMEGSRLVSLRGEVAVIPVLGPIFRHANLFTEISGATSTGLLATDFQAALDNPAVRRIVLDIDSPGGEMAGIHELVEQIYAARARKRVDAYVGGLGASAAYWIASATQSIAVSPTALLGSIGVVMTHIDTTERDAKAGIRQIDIVSSSSPFKRDDMRTDEARGRVQILVDQLCDVFVSSVARNRGIQSRKVLESFGKGGLLVGAAAVRAGMADREGNLEDLIADKMPSASSAKIQTSGSEGHSSKLAESRGATSTCDSAATMFARRRATVLGVEASQLGTGLPQSREPGSGDSERSSSSPNPGGHDSLSPAAVFERRAAQVSALEAAALVASSGSNGGRDTLSPSTVFERRAAQVSALEATARNASSGNSD